MTEQRKHQTEEFEEYLEEYFVPKSKLSSLVAELQKRRGKAKDRYFVEVDGRWDGYVQAIDEVLVLLGVEVKNKNEKG